MIIIEKTETSVGLAIECIIREVFGFDSEFGRSVSAFLDHKNRPPINSIPCSSGDCCSINSIKSLDDTIKITNSSTIDATIAEPDKEEISNTTYNYDFKGWPHMFEAQSDHEHYNNIFDGYTGLKSYKDFVEYVLFTIGNNIPTPSKLGNLYNLTIANNFTSIKFPNNTSISIKVFTSKDSIKYCINITFHSTPVCDPYIRESDEFKSAIAHGWKVKEDFNKPIKKRI